MVDNFFWNQICRGSVGSLCYACYVNNDMLKILGTHFPYIEKLKEEKKIVRL